jgi:hypothetical protein
MAISLIGAGSKPASALRKLSAFGALTAREMASIQGGGFLSGFVDTLVGPLQLSRRGKRSMQPAVIGSEVYWPAP